MLPQPFDGYPYVVTRIGHTALRSVAVVPSDWSRERLIDLTRRQAIANQLETCLCLGPAESVFVTPDGTATHSDFVPAGIPVPVSSTWVEIVGRAPSATAILRP